MPRSRPRPAPQAANLPLPLGLTERDLTYPKMGSGDEVDSTAGDYGSLELYEVEGRRGRYWAMATLTIRKAGYRSRRVGGQGDRTYAVTVPEGDVCRVGMGPHVIRTLRVYVRRSRRAALEPLLKLHREGSVAANQIRDRIGSRRAEGALRRAGGETWWRWSS